jgi:hypothetical protein
MIGACEIVARSFRFKCQDALGLRAGATIAVLGGRCAEKSSVVELTDAQKNGVLEQLLSQPVDDHVGVLLALHTCVEKATSGRAHYMVRLESVALISLLNRLLPGVVDSTLDKWDWDSIVKELEGDDCDAS